MGDSFSLGSGAEIKPKGGFDGPAFFSFRWMVSGTLMKVIYVIGMAGVTFWGLIMILEGTQSNWGGGGLILLGLAIIVFGNLWWRIACEFSVLLFSMHEILGSIEQSLHSRVPAATPLFQTQTPVRSRDTRGPGIEVMAGRQTEVASALTPGSPSSDPGRVCRTCGTWVKAGAAFCGSCGARVMT